MNQPFIFLKPDTKATLKWEFKDKWYDYSKIEFTIDGDDLIIRFIPVPRCKKQGWKPKRLRVKRFRERPAGHLLNKHPDFGRHFEEGVLTVYRDLGLPLCTKPILRGLQ